MDETIYVVRREPLDFFGPGTIPVGEWISRDGESAAEAIRACAAVTQHPSWEAELREPPRVGYCFHDQTPIFVFKIDNNGTTFLVGRSANRYRDGDHDPDAVIAVKFRAGRPLGVRPVG